MKNVKRVITIATLLLCASCGGGGGGGSDRNLVAAGRIAWLVKWNSIAIDASGRDHAPGSGREQLGPVRAARAMAIVHSAIADAVAAQSQKFNPFLPVDDAPAANLRAAIAQAGHDTL